MDIEATKEWIAALRSKKYKQAKFKLKQDDTENSFCCLGVACELRNYDWSIIHAEEYLIGIPTNEILELYGIDRPLTENEKNDLLVLYGVKKRVTANSFRHIADWLVYANDYLDWKFFMIADWLEKYLILS